MRPINTPFPKKDGGGGVESESSSNTPPQKLRKGWRGDEKEMGRGIVIKKI